MFYDAPVVSNFCAEMCAPGITGKSAVDVVDLEHTGQPDVVLDLYSGGAHCCTVVQIFSFDPGTMTYVKTERNFGDPGVRIVDERHNGRFEFVTADDSFAYEFTDYAGSALPLEILSFSNGHFTNVTGSYPKLLAKEAALYLKFFNEDASTHYQDSVGLAAAWAADEERLGHGKLVKTFLDQQASLGHLNSALYPGAERSPVRHQAPDASCARTTTCAEAHDTRRPRRRGRRPGPRSGPSRPPCRPGTS